MGVKKSTVWTSARSAVRRYTPASSAVSKPMRTLGSVCFGSLASTESKILGLNLAAQPAAFTIAVRRVRSSIESHYMLHVRGIPIESGADMQGLACLRSATFVDIGEPMSAPAANSLVQYLSFVIRNYTEPRELCCFPLERRSVTAGRRS